MLNKTLESPLDCKEIQPVHAKGNKSWIFIGKTDAEVEPPILWPPDGKNWLIRKDLMQGKIKGRRQRGRQKMKLLGGSTNLMNMSLSKIWELVMDRETWNTAPHDIEKSWTWLRDWTELMYRKHQGTGRRLWGPVNPVALVGVGKDLGGRGGFPSSGAGAWIQDKEHKILNVLPNIVFKKKRKKKNLLSAGVRTLTESVL